jgi:hypothetical protein
VDGHRCANTFARRDMQELDPSPAFVRGVPMARRGGRGGGAAGRGGVGRGGGVN